MQDRDYYGLLGIEPTANPDQIRNAYRDLAFILHPDRLPAARERARSKAEAYLKRLNEAYEVLGDPSRRCQYDRMFSSSPAECPAPAKGASQSARPSAAPKRSRADDKLANVLPFLLRIAGLIALISAGLFLITTLVIILLSVVLVAAILLFVLFVIAALLHS